jgi:DNA-binding response OmpR family regulator
MFRILVVAYDESPISPLAAYVKAEGYTVTVLEDARSRDLIGRQWPFDLIVVNWDAPEILPLLLSLIQLPHVRADKNVALVIFVKYADDREVVNDIPVGIHQHVIRPLALKDLLDRVMDLIYLSSTDEPRGSHRSRRYSTGPEVPNRFSRQAQDQTTVPSVSSARGTHVRRWPGLYPPAFGGGDLGTGRGCR